MNEKCLDWPPYYCYWGKTTEDGQIHLLPYHLLDVAAVGFTWWHRDAVIRRLFVSAMAENEDTCLAWVLFFLALHDLGKIDIRFQLKAPEALLSLRPSFDREDAEPGNDYFHGPSGWEWFVLDSTRIGLSERDLTAWGDWMRAVCGHHGSLQLGGAFSRPLAEKEVIEFDATARVALIRKLEAFFLRPAGSALNSILPPCPDLLSGFCSVCDWIGSNQALFTAVSECFSFDEYWYEVALERAAEALNGSGVFNPSLSKGGMAVLYPDYAPRQVQTLVEQLPLVPGLTLIEAPTGSGKTEAALAYASRLLSAGLADSIIFALPTQATANAMFMRLEAVAQKLFPCGANILLAHGRANYNPEFQALKSGLRFTAQGVEEAAAECVAWLSSSRKRAFLGQLGVCTIDQVFLSVLPVRHQFVRAFGVRKSVLIIDEVHAYDTYMYGLLENVIKGQRLAGSSAILLSATLPAWQKALLLGEDEASDRNGKEAYPKIAHVSNEGAMRHYVPSNDQQPEPFEVALESWQTSDMMPNEEHLTELISAADQGALVGVVCNLVADAQSLSARLKRLSESAGIDVIIDLFHARYRFKDRQEMERAVMRDYGKNADRQHGRILVATQVIEQSLDLDFDWLITQLCPVDLLFQRIGRLHRHPDKTRPKAFATPVCTVLLPTSDDYELHQVIYGHRQVLWRTQWLVQQNRHIAFPDAYRDWIERVYDAQPWPGEPMDISVEAERYRDDCTGKFYGAKVVSVTQGQPLPDTEGAAGRLTRDGEMNRSVVPVQAGERFVLLDGENLNAMDEGDRDEAMDMNTIGVPAGWEKWLPRPDDKGYIWVEMDDCGGGVWGAVLGKHQLTYEVNTGLLHLQDE